MEDLGVDGEKTCNEYAFCTANVNSLLFLNVTGVPSGLTQEQRDFVTERSYKEKMIF